MTSNLSVYANSNEDNSQEQTIAVAKDKMMNETTSEEKEIYIPQNEPKVYMQEETTQPKQKFYRLLSEDNETVSILQKLLKYCENQFLVYKTK